MAPGLAGQILAPDEVSRAPRANLRLAWLISGLGTASIIVLLWLAWDLRIDTAYTWCAIVAIAASFRIWVQLMRLPVAVVCGLLAALLPRISKRGIDLTSRIGDARRRGSDLVNPGNLRVAQLGDEHAAQPLWRFRLVALGKLGYVPLLVALWLT